MTILSSPAAGRAKAALGARRTARVMMKQARSKAPDTKRSTRIPLLLPARSSRGGMPDFLEREEERGRRARGRRSGERRRALAKSLSRGKRTSPAEGDLENGEEPGVPLRRAKRVSKSHRIRAAVDVEKLLEEEDLRRVAEEGGENARRPPRNPSEEIRERDGVGAEADQPDSPIARRAEDPVRHRKRPERRREIPRRELRNIARHRDDLLVASARDIPEGCFQLFAEVRTGLRGRRNEDELDSGQRGDGVPDPALREGEERLSAAEPLDGRFCPRRAREQKDAAARVTCLPDAHLTT